MESQGKKPRIAILVPAYNEEEQISLVLEVVSPAIGGVADEVLVIDDGSTDRTAEVVKKFAQVKLVSRKVNGGKGAALATGLENTDAEIIISLDADLLGLKEQHIRDLVKPLLDDGQVVMTVGKFQNGRPRTDWAQKIAPFLSGQRAMRRSLLESAGSLSEVRYALEVMLTRLAKQSGMKIVEVPISDASHVMKEEKLGLSRGVWARLKMYGEIVRHLFS